jgi:hypothetical protein
MPFDGTHAPRLIAYEKIEEVMKLIGSEDRWCKGSLSTLDGRRCLVAAMQTVHAQQMLEPIVLHAIRDVTGKHFRRIERFNDHRTTSHATVMRVLSRARDSLFESAMVVPEQGTGRGGFGGWLKGLWA